jgi:hypothetical protein
MSPDINALLKGFISSPVAGRRFGVTHDYVSLLCRRKNVEGVLVGRLWFVREDSLRSFLELSRARRTAQRSALSRAMKQGHAQFL